MKRYLLALACALLAFCPSRILAQVDCATIAQEEILHSPAQNLIDASRMGCYPIFNTSKGSRSAYRFLTCIRQC